MITTSDGIVSASADAAPAIDVQGARRVYPQRRGRPPIVALDGVALRVERGEWLALLGPNGCGKSTLLRMLATLERVHSGAASLLGHALDGGAASLHAARRRLGVVFQNPGLDPLLTVRENLLLQAALIGVSRTEAERRARAAAESLGIADRFERRVSTLSGGLARRADLARALLAEPEILLLDEPTNGLDVEARRGLMDLLDQRRLASLTPITIVMTTHLLDEAERATRVALMHAGRIVAEGTPADLRRALGGRVLVTRAEQASAVEAAGLTVKIDSGDVIGCGEADAVERAVLALTRAGASFSVAPPTLADVYRAHTGSRLADNGGRAP
jgi:ABC-2 type transport system ATP-binding protein